MLFSRIYKCARWQVRACTHANAYMLVCMQCSIHVHVKHYVYATVYAYKVRNAQNALISICESELWQGVCMYATCIHVCMYVSCVDIYVHTGMHTNRQIMHTDETRIHKDHIYIYIYICTHTSYIYICISKNAYTEAHMHTCMHTRIHTYMNRHKNIHTYIHT
jgi:hypothetical protein